MYRTDDLAVLVGTNPLPAYVAIRTLWNRTGRVFLIHTEETKSVAKRIVERAGLTVGHNGIPVQIDGMRPGDAQRKIGAAVQGSVSFGLNYTGGTKQMVVFAYQAAASELAQHGVKPCLSYLDAKTLQMRLELGSREAACPVGLSIKPTIEDILALHGYTPNTITRRVIAPDIYPHLLQIGARELKNWYTQNIVPLGKQDKSAVSAPTGAVFAPIRPYLGGAADLGRLAAYWETDLATVVNWFKDHWLEQYTLWAMRAVADECQLQDSAMNLKPKERNFEFDAVALRGYQMFAISCANRTNMDGLKKELKLKLFEAYVRARQMGGDEARIGLVCHAPDGNDDNSVRAIQGEMEEEWDAEGRVRVFGAAALPDLPRHLKRWFLGK